MVIEYDFLCMDKELILIIFVKNIIIVVYMLDLSLSIFKIIMLLRWWFFFILYLWCGGLFF